MAQKYLAADAARHRIHLATPQAGSDHPPALVVSLAGGCVPEPVHAVLTLGEAYALATDLLAAAETLLGSVGRRGGAAAGRTAARGSRGPIGPTAPGRSRS